MTDYPSRESLQRAYAAAFWEGLADRIRMQSMQDLFGDESQEAARAYAQHSANLSLANQSMAEVNHPLNKAAWTGYIDGSRRFAAIGSALLPREFTELTNVEQRAYELVYREINGWMLEYARDLPKIVEMIKLGVRGVDSRSELVEVFSFFETLVSGIEDGRYGNFGDGFTDEDRKTINEYVDHDWERAAELVERGWLKQEGRRD